MYNNGNEYQPRYNPNNIDANNPPNRDTGVQPPVRVKPPHSGTTMYECPKCHSTGHYKVLQKGPHIGLYCSKCGAYIKWLNEDERAFFEIPSSLKTECSIPNIEFPCKVGDTVYCVYTSPWAKPVIKETKCVGFIIDRYYKCHILTELDETIFNPNIYVNEKEARKVVEDALTVIMTKDDNDDCPF